MKTRLGFVALLAILPFAPVSPGMAAEPSCTHQETPMGNLARDVFIVFFDSGSFAVTARSAEILENVASAYRPLPHCLLIVAAHTDRVGSESDNVALSVRRANAVVAYLRRRSVRAAARIEPFGETRPLVETNDGVGEMQNRRAEIVIAPRDGS